MTNFKVLVVTTNAHRRIYYVKVDNNKRILHVCGAIVTQLVRYRSWSWTHQHFCFWSRLLDIFCKTPYFRVHSATDDTTLISHSSFPVDRLVVNQITSLVVNIWFLSKKCTLACFITSQVCIMMHLFSLSIVYICF